MTTKPIFQRSIYLSKLLISILVDGKHRLKTECREEERERLNFSAIQSTHSMTLKGKEKWRSEKKQVSAGGTKIQEAGCESATTQRECGGGGVWGGESQGEKLRGSRNGRNWEVSACEHLALPCFVGLLQEGKVGKTMSRRS